MDRVATTDQLSAGLAPYAPPAYPCSTCGKETKETRVRTTRICSSESCRVLTEVSSKKD